MDQTYGVDDASRGKKLSLLFGAALKLTMCSGP